MHLSSAQFELKPTVLTGAIRLLQVMQLAAINTLGCFSYFKFAIAKQQSIITYDGIQEGKVEKAPGFNWPKHTQVQLLTKYLSTY